jgi:hypothetical protein
LDTLERNITKEHLDLGIKNLCNWEIPPKAFNGLRISYIYIVII